MNFLKPREMSKPWLIGFICLLSQGLFAQYSVKHINDKHKAYYDSLKNMNYDRMFPIWGDKVYKKGFDIPWPIGIMINNFYGVQNIDISNIKVGIIQGDSTKGPVDLSQVIVFDKVEAAAYNINMRLDMFILPFLNVYVLGSIFPYASTSVTLSKPVQISTNPKQTGWGYGFGIMGAGGVGPVWLQADANFTWNDMELLETKVFTKVVGMRIGHTFPFKSNPEKNVSFWVGAMGVFLNNDTKGQVALDDLFPGMSQEKIDEIKNSYNNWYNTLSPVGKQVADKIVEGLQNRVDGGPKDGTIITYQMDKAVSEPWAGLIGMQYQFSKAWQLRMESNIIGDRTSILLSLNYRFLGFKKKK